MKAPNPSEPRTSTWPENILLCLVLLAPIALCIALFLPNRDNTDMPVLLAGIFLFASMISLFPVLDLQKDQQKIARATVPFVAACPLGILAVSNGGAMAWMFVLLDKPDDSSLNSAASTFAAAIPAGGFSANMIPLIVVILSDPMWQMSSNSASSPKTSIPSTVC